jgi:cytochrome P450
MSIDSPVAAQTPAAPGGPVHYDPFDWSLHEDPYPTYAWMQEHAPLYHNAERGFWALSRHADVSAALRNPALFSNRNGISIEPELWGPHAVKTSFFLAMDPPKHGDHRREVQTPFTPRHVVALEQRTRELARERLEPLRDQRRFDFATDYAAALPNDVVCEMLGVPSMDWDQVRADADLLNQRDDGSDERGASSTAAALRLAAYFNDLVRDLRRHPGSDLTSQMIQAEVNGQKHTDSELVAFLFLVITAGNESTGKTIGNAWYHGWRQPEIRRAGLNGRAADWATETLRYDSASQMTSRTVARPTVLHDTELPENALVLILPAAANRDHRVFADPDRFDLDRDTSRLISFGAGPHHCLGAALARLEMRVALEEMAALVSDYEIDLAGARRIHSPHQRGFATLPCEVTFRPQAR